MGAVIFLRGVKRFYFPKLAGLDLVRKMRNSPLFSAFLDAVDVALVAIIISVCYFMASETISDWRTLLIALISLVLTFGFRKVNSAFIVLGASLAGYLLSLISLS